MSPETTSASTSTDRYRRLRGVRFSYKAPIAGRGSVTGDDCGFTTLL